MRLPAAFVRGCFGSSFGWYQIVKSPLIQNSKSWNSKKWNGFTHISFQLYCHRKPGCKEWWIELCPDSRSLTTPSGTALLTTDKTPGLMLQCLVWWHGWHGLWFSWLCAPMPSPENSSRLGPRIKKLVLSPSTMETWQLGQLSQHGLAGFVHLFAIWVVLHTLDSAAAFYYTCWVFLSYALGTQGTFSRRAAPHKLIYVDMISTFGILWPSTSAGRVMRIWEPQAGPSTHTVFIFQFIINFLFKKYSTFWLPYQKV